VTRSAILLWCVASGVVMGLIAGVGALAALTLAAHVVPGLPERLVDRLRAPAVLVLLGVVPFVAAVLGYLEGRAKLP
jgi:hypothetical protein